MRSLLLNYIDCDERTLSLELFLVWELTSDLARHPCQGLVTVAE